MANPTGRVGGYAKEYAKSVPDSLADDTLSKEQSERLWSSLGSFADQSERLVVMMNDEGASEHYIEAGEAVQDVFIELHTVAGERAVELGSTLRA